ncbi:translation factor GTPase family protein [Actinopolymorpha sp. B9G3]|uniref:translation factor GTPase family protein n=1 Tax=Actinopolymorpha sp. B9G3 TaxID=3158970 RepID=UPI0032D95AB1
MSTLNLGILAHVDAGKTTLTERLLFAAGVIDKIGSVDDGSTQTDTLALERQRGITIKSAVVSFVLDDVTVNLIDTPGHPDFIAEVERVLSVLDGAVLVISAVEGVQAQTRVLMRTLQRLRIPTLIFVNKIDRGGAGYDRILKSIAEKLTPAIIPMGTVDDLGTRRAGFLRFAPSDAEFTGRLAELLAEHDEALLAAYVDDEDAVSYAQLSATLATQTGRAQVHPVYFGSAIIGAGTEALIAGITEFLPAVGGDSDGRTDHADAEAEDDGPVSGTVFKVERGTAGEKIAFVRMSTGTVRTRDRLRFGRDKEGKVTAIRVFDRGSAVQRASVTAGRIGKLWGLADVEVGDQVGEFGGFSESGGNAYFAPPTLETVVVSRSPGDKGALHVALAQLAEQDPLINLRQDDVRQEMYVSLYGEVQKEVIQATLERDYGIDVTFRETTMIYIERPVGAGTAVELLGKEGNPFLATVGLRIEPAPIGAGVDFRLDVKLESIPLYVYKTVEEFRKALDKTVRETLREGIYGWEVRDCTITLTSSGYNSPGSTSGDFRKLMPLVLMSALQQAGTVVCEPVHRFHLDMPADTLGAILPVLARLRAVPDTPTIHGVSGTLEGEIPAAQVHEFQQQVPGLTRGEGVLESFFDHHRPVSGAPPTRPRTDNNPLNRKEYLLHVLRGV